MQIAKPELTNLEKKRANELWAYMKDRGYCTKEELCRVLGWEYNNSNDRRLRELLAILASKLPVVSTSDSKGYLLAKNKEDGEAVLHALAELSKRIAEIYKRMPPLTDFLNKHNINTSPLNH